MATRQARYILAHLPEIKAKQKAAMATAKATKKFYCETCKKALSTAGNLRWHIVMSREHKEALAAPKPAEEQKQPGLINNPVNLLPQPIQA